MEALSIQRYGELFRSGSLLGVSLLLYSSAVSALCLFKKKFRPLNISDMEKTSYTNIVEALALPALILALTYAVSYSSMLNGFLIWAVTYLAFVLIVKLARIHILAGVHCLLSGIALAVGVYLVVGTFPV